MIRLLVGNWAGWLRMLPRHALIGAIRGYRLLLSPWLGNACRFEPTCSQYAIGALQRHGAMAGCALAVGRIARCHPWCAGGHDPVPVDPPWGFRRLTARPPGSAPHPSDDASGAASS